MSLTMPRRERQQQARGFDVERFMIVVGGGAPKRLGFDVVEVVSGWWGGWEKGDETDSMIVTKPNF